MVEKRRGGKKQADCASEEHLLINIIRHVTFNTFIHSLRNQVRIIFRVGTIQASTSFPVTTEASRCVI